MRNQFYLVLISFLFSTPFQSFGYARQNDKPLVKCNITDKKWVVHQDGRPVIFQIEEPTTGIEIFSSQNPSNFELKANYSGGKFQTLTLTRTVGTQPQPGKPFRISSNFLGLVYTFSLYGNQRFEFKVELPASEGIPMATGTLKGNCEVPEIPGPVEGPGRHS